jgi:hypothetical protein
MAAPGVVCLYQSASERRSFQMATHDRRHVPPLSCPAFALTSAQDWTRYDKCQFLHMINLHPHDFQPNLCIYKTAPTVHPIGYFPISRLRPKPRVFGTNELHRTRSLAWNAWNVGMGSMNDISITAGKGWDHIFNRVTVQVNPQCRLCLPAEMRLTILSIPVT